MIHVYLYRPNRLHINISCRDIDSTIKRKEKRDAVSKSRHQRFRRQGVKHKDVFHGSTFFDILIFIGTSVCSQRNPCSLRLNEWRSGVSRTEGAVQKRYTFKPRSSVQPISVHTRYSVAGRFYTSSFFLSPCRLTRNEEP